jgi:catechol 2,3-dioxygenase
MSDAAIHPQTKLGHVHLTVSDLDRSLEFYQQIIGLQLHRREGETAYLGAGRTSILALTGRTDARRVRGATGLYHFAILVPSRLALAYSLRRIAETQTPAQGFADHLVSEAIYLADPDGNGIEIYRDRPRDQWPYQNGQLQMATDPLDIEGVLAELEGQADPWSGLAPQTVLGHMHLHVANIAQAEAFYQGVIGFAVMLRYGPTASFLAAGGYHHHLGVNTWAGVGAPPPPADAVGLRWFVICLPDQAELNRTVDRVRQAGVDVEERPEGLLVRDPSQNGVILTTSDVTS